MSWNQLFKFRHQLSSSFLAATTSPELSIPQSKLLKSFYKIFKISSSNIDEGDKIKAYQCDIIYGSINELEADVLREEYLQQGTRSKRPFDIVIVDEADSMLLDGMSNVTRLSSMMPGMSNLLPILAVIWMELERIENSLKSDRDGKILYTISENGADVEKSVDPKDLPRSELLKHLVKREMKNLLTSQMEEDRVELDVPNHLREFVMKNRLHAWVNSAYSAKFDFVKGKHYIIRDDEVKIVDLHNTGIVHKNMKWTDGLHQFIQIKEKVPLTSEELTTNFLGNPTFFYKYGSNIYGLTGTLGCDSTKQFLLNAYGVESIILPSFKVKQHIALTPIVVKSKDDWYESIVFSCLSKLKHRRAVMIIAESINETEEIKKIFRSAAVNYPAEKILMYRTEKDSSVIAKQVEPGEVIITTNICGRGTDIVLTDEVNRTGGLHICLTFLPENLRVQMQNVGRTSRAGNPGTSQIVLMNEANRSLDDLQKERDDANAIVLERSSAEMEKIKTKSVVFEKFCKLLNIIDGTSPIPTHWNLPSIDRRNLQSEVCRDAVKEKFSIWLKLNERFSDELEREFDRFEMNIREDAARGTLTDNPHYFIISGNKYLKTRYFAKAAEQFSAAINIDACCDPSAFYNRSVAHNELNTDGAIADLRSAKEVFMLHQRRLKSISSFTANCPILAQKFQRKFFLLQLSVLSILQAIETKSDGRMGDLLSAKLTGKSMDMFFGSWKEKIPNQNEVDAYSKEALELKKNGWLGPIEIREMGVLKPLVKMFFSRSD